MLFSSNIGLSQVDLGGYPGSLVVEDEVPHAGSTLPVHAAVLGVVAPEDAPAVQWAYRRTCNASLEWYYDCSKMPVKSLHGHSRPKNCTFVEPSPDSPCGPSYCRPSANCYHANIFSILFYRDDIIEKDPAKTWGPQFYDARAGTAIWRGGFTQRFDDEIVVATSARSADGGWG